MTDELLQFFEYGHLKPELREVSKLFHDLAHKMADTVPSNMMRMTALYHLLEAKDCAVRAVLYKDPYAEMQNEAKRTL